MAKIQVDVHGRLVDVTKAQLFELARGGEVVPETRLIVDGKETKAQKVQGIAFGIGEGISVMPPVPVETPMPIPVPVPEPKPEEVEMTNRLLVLCLASLIPGLGHFLLGCDTRKCTFICFLATVKFVLCVGLLSFCAFFLVNSISDGITGAIAEKDYEKDWSDDMKNWWKEIEDRVDAQQGRVRAQKTPNTTALFIGAAIHVLVLQLLLAIIIGFSFWLVYPGVISDLKAEYSKRHPSP